MSRSEAGRPRSVGPRPDAPPVGANLSSTRTHASWAVLACLAWLALAACALSGCPTRAARVQGIRIACSEPTASVFVDGRFIGQPRLFRGRVVRLGKGLHLIEVRKQGYFARYRQVRVKPGQVVDLKIRLYRELE